MLSDRGSSAGNELNSILEVRGKKGDRKLRYHSLALIQPSNTKGNNKSIHYYNESNLIPLFITTHFLSSAHLRDPLCMPPFPQALS